LQTEFIDYHPHHLALVLADLRPADETELWRIHGGGFAEDVANGIGCASHRWTMCIGSHVAAVFGATQIAPGIGAPWLVGSSVLEGRGGRLVRQMPVYIQQLLQSYDLLTNYVDTGNTQATTWLRHMGFSFHEVVEIGGAPFQRFAMESDRV
jgi:hypothetical protein